MDQDKHTLNADQIIKHLNLSPHPEGGYFRETFRDTKTYNGRSVSTLIYYLLKYGQSSHWHRIDAAEVWHWYAGSPLKLTVSNPENLTSKTILLSNKLQENHCPQYVVEKHVWQTAVTTGAWSLVGCSVAPGFEFTNFELAPVDWSPDKK